MKKILINQPRGMGDIIFIIAIVQKYIKDGYEVIFPIDMSWINYTSIQKNFPEVNFISLDDFSEYNHYDVIHEPFEDEKYIYIPFRWSTQPTMQTKYDMVSLPMEMWREIKIIRDLDAESELIMQLNIAPDEKFNLINKQYVNRERNNMIFNTNNGYRNIFMSKTDGFNIFDWMGVIEKAHSIHTVHTSIHYLIDIMPNVTSDLHIYPRIEKNEPHSYYDYLFIKKYNYHS